MSTSKFSSSSPSSQARSVFTRFFRFSELEQSLHVRTGGRALFHGAWARVDTSTPSNTNSSRDDAGMSGSQSSEDEDAETTCDGEGDGVSDFDTYGNEGEQGIESGAVKGGTPGCTKRRYNRGIDKGGDPEGHVGRTKDATKQAMRKRIRLAWPSWSITKEKEIQEGTEEVEQSRKRRRKGKERETMRARWKNTELRPHGEGYVEFFDGWGVSQVKASTGYSECVMRYPNHSRFRI